MDGITGCYSPGDKDLVQKIFLATGAVQHWGKASAGVAIGAAVGAPVLSAAPTAVIWPTAT